MTNVALRKSALQSSISQWSSAQTIEADASIATNGDIVSDTYFHTNRENKPWWQVDLQDEFVIEQVHIFNRRDYSERLKRFTVLVSLTGQADNWVQVYRKVTETIFGYDDNDPFIIIPDIGCIARFVRIRLDGIGFLHFRECQVLGYRPAGEHHAHLRNQTLLLQPRVADERVRRERELADGRQGHITRIDSHDVFVDTENYSPIVVRVLSSDLYEWRERQIINATILSSDRVLEIGTAIGVVAMSVAAIVGPTNVITYDANPAMVADARRNFAVNGYGEIRPMWA